MMMMRPGRGMSLNSVTGSSRSRGWQGKGAGRGEGPRASAGAAGCGRAGRRSTSSGPARIRGRTGWAGRGRPPAPAAAGARAGWGGRPGPGAARGRARGPGARRPAQSRGRSGSPGWPLRQELVVDDDDVRHAGLLPQPFLDLADLSDAADRAGQHHLDVADAGLLRAGAEVVADEVHVALRHALGHLRCGRVVVVGAACWSVLAAWLAWCHRQASQARVCRTEGQTPAALVATSTASTATTAYSATTRARWPKPSVRWTLSSTIRAAAAAIVSQPRLDSARPLPGSWLATQPNTVRKPTTRGTSHSQRVRSVTRPAGRCNAGSGIQVPSASVAGGPAGVGT